MRRRLRLVDNGKLEFARESAFSSNQDRIKTSDCGEIENITEFVRYAAVILAQLGIIHLMRPDLLLTFTKLIKAKGKDEAICLLTKQIYGKKNTKREAKNRKKKRKAMKTSRARRNASTISTPTK